MAKLALSDAMSPLPEFFDDSDFSLGDEIFGMLDNLESFDDFLGEIPKIDKTGSYEVELEGQKSKRQKLAVGVDDETASFGEHKNITHITVERNRRKQMNEHLSVLRSLMPSFYVKRGDQASIIGGVVDYIKELQQVLSSLEARKQRKSYYEVLSPRLIPSPRVALSPKKPPLSPRVNLPTSPRTPTSSYKPRSPLMIPQGYHIRELSPSHSSSSTTNSAIDSLNELVANSNSRNANVEVKFCGANVLLKTVSGKIPRQAVKIMSAIEELSLEILNANIGTIDETMVNSFTVKIGIECQLSAEELAQQIQQTFC